MNIVVIYLLLPIVFYVFCVFLLCSIVPIVVMSLIFVSFCPFVAYVVMYFDFLCFLLCPRVYVVIFNSSNILPPGLRYSSVCYSVSSYVR